MRQTARIISTYSADVFGVCSALFELGGMTVMHDASGCNSTYTTHDEPRWYDMDSMVYLSGLSEMEAVMGDDEKLIRDIADAAVQLKPKFIAIAGTPIPTMTGFDFAAVAHLIEQETGIPSFGFPTTGMNTYIHGASMALEGIARRFVREAEKGGPVREAEAGGSAREAGSALSGRKIRVNILGLTPLDFSVNGQDGSIAAFLEESGFTVQSRWAMGCSLEELSRAGEADVNLVVSAAGLGAARALHERFGIPQVVGLPIGAQQRAALARDIELSAQDKESRVCHPEGTDRPAGGQPAETGSLAGDPSDGDSAGSIAVIGEGITSLALAQALSCAGALKTRVLCATECGDGILRKPDRMTPDEDDIIPELAGAKVVIADPLYKPVCPEGAGFVPLPSEAFSGRIYRSGIPDLMRDKDLDEMIRSVLAVQGAQ